MFFFKSIFNDSHNFALLSILLLDFESISIFSHQLSSFLCITSSQRGYVIINKRTLLQDYYFEKL